MSETEALLAEFDQDPEGGLSKIMDRFEKPLVRHARAVLLDTELAKDVVQETFIRFLTEKPRPDNLGGWLYRVATNLGFNALRSARRRSHYEAISYENSAGPAAASRSAGAMDPAQAAELADERAQVQAVLRQMKPRDAQILVLRHSGLSYKEIAAALEIAPGSVGTLLARAERAFEQMYDDH